MTTNYVPNATGLIANQQYRGATWGPNVTSVPIASHSYNGLNPQVRYTSFTGLAPFPTAYATTHPVQRVNSATSPANTNSSSSSQGGTMSTSLSTSANSSLCTGSANNGGSANSTSGNTNSSANGGGSAKASCDGGELSKTNLYIRGLSQNTTDKDLVTMCSQYGTIMSTKAIMDKNTNKCRGYGFVDFESDASADSAVRGLQAKGVQAQMAKVGISSVIRRSANPHQEQDPTNLYFANLPLNFKEHDLESLLSKYGNVVSTRVLRDEVNISKGVGFARMDTKDKCEKIIQALNGTIINGAKDPLLIKFADGGPKKRFHKPDSGHVFDPNGFQQNGIATTPILPASAITPYSRHYNATQPIAGYSVPTQWVPQYIVQPTPHMTQMDVVPQADPNAVTYSSMIPQITAHVSAIQLGTPGSYIAASPHPNTYPYCAAVPSIIHNVPVPASEEHPPNAVSPDEYQPYPLKFWYPDARGFYNGIPMDFINNVI